MLNDPWYVGSINSSSDARLAFETCSNSRNSIANTKAHMLIMLTYNICQPPCRVDMLGAGKASPQHTPDFQQGGVWAGRAATSSDIRSVRINRCIYIINDIVLKQTNEKNTPPQ